MEAELHQLLLASGRAHVLWTTDIYGRLGCRLLQPVTSKLWVRDCPGVQGCCRPLLPLGRQSLSWNPVEA